MAKAEVVNRRIVINLELQEDEAKYLRDLTQNDLSRQYTNASSRESDADRKIREEIFEELSIALKNQ